MTDDLENLAGPLPRSIPRFSGEPPINLPSFTFLVGDLMNCHMLAAELGKASSFVYEEDFHAPIYDAVLALYNLPHLVKPHEIATKYDIDVLAIRHAVKLDLVSRLITRAEELLSFHPYQIVVRDAGGFALPAIPLLKDCVVVNLEQYKLYRGVNPISSLTLPPGADILKELRNFCS